MFDFKNDIVVVRGAGDLATGTIVYLKKAGFRVIALECARPTTIRRTVAFSECVYENTAIVEEVNGVKVQTAEEALSLSKEENTVPILIDEKAESLKAIKPRVLVDAIIAKRNVGTKITDAPLVVALGPGFTAKKDCHVCIETSRGHYLGSIIEEGTAIPNTGIPGIIGGVGKERVVHSLNAGIFKGVKQIGDTVKQGEVIAYVGEEPLLATISGTLRGLLHDGLEVPKGFKVADIDPRDVKEYIHHISDKARCIAGGVLLAILSHTK